MKQSRLWLGACLSAAVSLTPLAAETKKADIDAIAKNLGAETIRGIDSDIAFPADAEEYMALGKNAVMMVKASSAVSTELPLWSVYAQYSGTRIPLQRVLLLGKYMDATTSRALQVSFYLLPIQFMKRDVRVLADFSGGRKAFGFTTFTKKGGLPSSSPAFARLDEYDTPGDADPAAIARLIAREFPDNAQ